MHKISSILCQNAPITVFFRFKTSGIERYQDRTENPMYYPRNRAALAEEDLNEYSVKTFKGYVPLSELNEKVSAKLESYL